MLLRRVVRDAPSGEGLAQVYALAGDILLHEMRAPTTAYQYLLTALDLGPDPATRAAVRDALAEIDLLQKRQVGRVRTPTRWS